MSFCLCSPHQFLGTDPAKGLKNKGFLGSVPHRIRSAKPFFVLSSDLLVLHIVGG